MNDKSFETHLENKLNLERFCRFYDIGTPVSLCLYEAGGLTHQLWKISTTKNTYLIKKYPISEKQKIKRSWVLMRYFKENQVPLVLPEKMEAEYSDNGMLWSLYPYLKGEVLHPSQVTLSHCKEMGMWLRKLHTLTCPIGAETYSDISGVDSQEVLYWISAYAPKKILKNWCSAFDENASLLQNKLVMSHRDLYPANVIWQSPDCPVFIDWDEMGWINQELELFTTAINWAGIVLGTLNMTYYRMFLNEYSAFSDDAFIIDESIISASLGSWLNWLIFNEKRIQSKESTDQQKKESRSEIALSLNALFYLTSHRKSLIWRTH